MSKNTPALVHSLLDLLTQAEISVCLFGGWAEECWGLIPPRDHHDIDLLYPGISFDAVDSFLRRTPQFSEFCAKRFSHKRAALYHNVMVEFLLVTASSTLFFQDRFIFTWPPDTFTQRRDFAGRLIPIASLAALNSYRAQHARVQQAYMDSIQGSKP